MKSSKVLLLLCLAATAAAQTPPPSGTDPGKYDVLGLKLGITAKAAEDIISARFHVKPDHLHYNIFAGVAQFVPNRPYVSGIYLEAGEVILILNFAEVVPGEAPGSEILWHIGYKPVLKSEADKQLFVSRVLERYGKPVNPSPSQDYFWANKVFTSHLAYYGAGIPFLQLTTYTPELALENAGILRHMTEVFNAKQRSNAPPL